MKSKKPSRAELLSSCQEVGPEDGIDPRIVERRPLADKVDRKALQLCSEVARTLSYALAWEIGDDLLDQLVIESVVPAPSTGKLLVSVGLPNGIDPADADDVLERLQRCTGRLRAAVAASIRRRRVPELRFRVVSMHGLT